ncbi:hypothetical protein Lwor_2227 [Legionella worsleiensis]|uniref:Uncharacterized protein n=1 Tax=Legionella worsleiensis TaxID=45076 RepID=A0A0W1A420_9GAMM|nr:hypothetical protein Lwor_2227 [Legionella worsleiensis]STY33313.1 Uncharacterised protein [Legionella worsleiensis]
MNESRPNVGECDTAGRSFAVLRMRIAPAYVPRLVRGIQEIWIKNTFPHTDHATRD